MLRCTVIDTTYSSLLRRSDDTMLLQQDEVEVDGAELDDAEEAQVLDNAGIVQA
jgi:hypothetical protein